ncbi:MAG: hypothetical protein LW855_08390, partial [Alphaproteobacteria bacterium]|nr:hypothetical protein [Alphaproteobacteria bacterium]
MIRVQFAAAAAGLTGTVVVFVAEGELLQAPASGIKEADIKKIRELLALNDYKGKKGSSDVLLRPAGLPLDRLVVVGLGKASALTPLAAQEAGGAAYARLAGIPG